MPEVDVQGKRNVVRILIVWSLRWYTALNNELEGMYVYGQGEN